MAKVTVDNQKTNDAEEEVLQRRPKSQKKNLTDDEIHAGLRKCLRRLTLCNTVIYIKKLLRYIYR